MTFLEEIQDFGRRFDFVQEGVKRVEAVSGFDTAVALDCVREGFQKTAHQMRSRLGKASGMDKISTVVGVRVGKGADIYPIQYECPRKALLANNPQLVLPLRFGFVGAEELVALE